MPVKVECESCKAPYTIDERRIPAAGLRVRCPKCTKTFVVKKPASLDASPASETPATKPATPAAVAIAVSETKPSLPAAVPNAAAQKPAPKPVTPAVPATRPKHDTLGSGESLAKLPASPPAPPQSSRPPSDETGDMDLPAPAPPPGAADAFLPAARASAAKPPGSRAAMKGTQLGLGGLVPGVVSTAGMQAKPEADLPAARTDAAQRARDLDLPATPAAKPNDLDLPAVPAAKPKAIDVPAAPAAKPKEIDLPAVPAAKPREVDLPAVAAKPKEAPKAPAAAAKPRDVDLPAVPAAKNDLPAIPAAKPKEVDLPAVAAKVPLRAGPPPTKKSGEPDAPPKPEPAAFGEVDLPAVGARADLPAAARPAPPRAPAKPSFDAEPSKPAIPKPQPKGPAFDDLPSVAAKPALPQTDAPTARRGTQLEFGEADLPAVGARADLPAVGARADLPAVGARADLPAIGGRDAAPPRPHASTQPFGELDLPQVRPGGGHLPAIHGHADLPAPAGAHLPAIGGAGLPAVSAHANLPAVAPTNANLPAIAPAGQNLPAVAPAGHNLPAVAPAGQNLPAVAPAGHNLPVVAPVGPNLPVVAPVGPNLPNVAPAGPNLPNPREPSVAISPEQLRADPFARDLGIAQTQVGIGSPGDGGAFGELELPGPGLAPAAPATHDLPGPDLGFATQPSRGFGEVDFGEPAGGDFGRPPSLAPQTGASDFGELELPGPGASFGAAPATNDMGPAPLDSIGPPGPSPFSGNIGLEGSVASQVDSRATGGAGFGEVDLGGGGSLDDDMEFGAIPQQRADLQTDAAPYEAPLPRPRAATAEPSAPQDEPKKSNVGRVFAGLFVLLLLGGAALSFHEKLGPFGYRAISDKLNAEKHASLASDAIAKAREGFGADTLKSANEAIDALQASVASAPRYAPLAAYSAYAQFAHQIRFGRDAQRDSLARTALAKVEGNAPHKTLAEAARDVVAGQLPAARGVLQGLLGGDDALEAAITLGELELLAKQPKDAIAAFEKAIKIKDDARSRAGLMRAYDASGQPDKATKEAEALAAKHKTHVASRVLLARHAWEHDKDEKKALEWLSELDKLAPLASPKERIDALTLRGTIFLDRGRVTDARKAFEEAIAAAKGPAPAPQIGLGEVYMANGQYAQAISAFSTAAQAAPELTIAKIGIARALLKQEKATEAKATLAPLKDPALAGEIGFWLGQAEEKTNPDKPSEAIKIYEAAIKAQPSEVKPYIALANLQTKIGKVEDADATLAAASKNVPPSERLHLGIGELRFRQERYAQALDHFDKALALQPANLEALFYKGRALLRMEKSKWEDAKKVLDEVEAKDKHYPGLTLEFGLYYQKTDQIEKALDKYKDALKAAPDDVDVQLMVARAQVEANMKEAEESLRELLGKCSKSPAPDICVTETKHFLGRALLNRGAYGEASTYLQQAVEKGDNNAQYHLYYGWVLVEQEKWDDAERELARALELDKSLAVAYSLRAQIMSRRGQFKEAIEMARQALAMNAGRHEAHAIIAFSQNKLGLEDAALAEYAKAIAGDPKNPRAPWWRFQVADIHFHKNTTPKALADIREAVKVASGMEPKPGWLPKAYFYLGEAARYVAKPEAIDAYRKSLETSVGTADPFRKEARAALAELGSPYSGP